MRREPDKFIEIHRIMTRSGCHRLIAAMIPVVYDCGLLANVVTNERN